MPSPEMDEFKTDSGTRTLDRNLEDRDLVEKLLLQLPPLYRSIVVLHYMQGLNCQEVSEIIQRPVGTVKAYLHRAREKLRLDASRLLSDLDDRRDIKDMAS